MELQELVEAALSVSSGAPRIDFGFQPCSQPHD